MIKIIITALLTGFITTAHAGFDEGVAAAEAGNYKVAHAEWLPLANQGNSSAQFNLGILYSNGRGVPKDDAQAVTWFRKAAEQGYAKAQNLLATRYVNGQGVPKDYLQAFTWYLQAAVQGNADAQYSLGRMYSLGWGVAKDDVQAAFWWGLSAEQGDTYAQLMLAMAYGGGYGVRQNSVVSYALYNLASVVSKDEGAMGRGIVEKRLDPVQIEAAQRLTSEIAKPNNLNKAILEYLKNSK